jgi:ABC-type nickel/cobalt efflux system permease component RcnA
LEFVESFRGNLAAWLLIAFGMVYFVWGLRRAYKRRPHAHSHSHFGEVAHEHMHGHESEHAHVHETKRGSVTPWMLFVIFVFGPCEPLIPVLMYPAAENNLFGLLVVTFVFGAVTIATMLGAVLLSRAGVKSYRLAPLERYAHVIAGATICLCGLAIRFLNL